MFGFPAPRKVHECFILPLTNPFCLSLPVTFEWKEKSHLYIFVVSEDIFVNMILFRQQTGPKILTGQLLIVILLCFHMVGANRFGIMFWANPHQLSFVIIIYTVTEDRVVSDII